ncbi:hypothetical protein BDN71DRAFT_1436644 [Pleurotus eryngii]|uniref:Uncharacterized protein n=1 Tax=Pleurotus eryngii TaxID=5323 RepID=A0A9P5ZJX5_PLEER|nr:hypothetical protein BDN71DRAFT_1436644 [Pleurotus eryngii]
MGILALHLFMKYTRDLASAQVEQHIFHVGDVVHAHIRAMDAEAERDAIQIRMNTLEQKLREEWEKVKALELEWDGEAAQVDVGSDERKDSGGGMEWDRVGSFLRQYDVYSLLETEMQTVLMLGYIIRVRPPSMRDKLDLQTAHKGKSYNPNRHTIPPECSQYSTCEKGTAVVPTRPGMMARQHKYGYQGNHLGWPDTTRTARQHKVYTDIKTAMYMTASILRLLLQYEYQGDCPG